MTLSNSSVDWNSSAGVLGNEGAAPLSRKSWKISVGGKFSVWSKTQVHMWPLTSSFRTIARSVEEISLYLPDNVWTRGLNVSLFLCQQSLMWPCKYLDTQTTLFLKTNFTFLFCFHAAGVKVLVCDVWSQLPTSSHWCNLSYELYINH